MFCFSAPRLRSIIPLALSLPVPPGPIPGLLVMDDPAGKALAAAVLPRAYVDPRILNNMTTIQFDKWAYNLSDTQTGCYNKGSLPLALAANDTCLLGFWCT